MLNKKFKAQIETLFDHSMSTSQKKYIDLCKIYKGVGKYCFPLFSFRQDKFGRGVPVTLAKQLSNPKTLKVVHPLRYNTTLSNPCRVGFNQCSHLCIMIPGGKSRCKCPTGQSFINTDRTICDAGTISYTFKVNVVHKPMLLFSVTVDPKALPLVCPCLNGGVCTGNAQVCQCEDNFSGSQCETEVTKVRTFGVSSPAAVFVPVFLIVVVILTAGGLYVYWRRKQAG